MALLTGWRMPGMRCASLCCHRTWDLPAVSTSGLRIARGDLLLLLNNDAFVEPGCVPALVETMRQHPQIGAVAGVLTFDHRPELVASAGITTRCDGVALDRWTGRDVHSLPAAPQPVMGASGGLALYRRTMLDDIGLMAPNFFNYLEDVDLAWRASCGNGHAFSFPLPAPGISIPLPVGRGRR